MLLCGVLDLAAACLQAWTQAGRPPVAVVKGIASAVRHMIAACQTAH